MAYNIAQPCFVPQTNLEKVEIHPLQRKAIRLMTIRNACIMYSGGLVKAKEKDCLSAETLEYIILPCTFFKSNNLIVSLPNLYTLSSVAPALHLSYFTRLKFVVKDSQFTLHEHSIHREHASILKIAVEYF